MNDQEIEIKYFVEDLAGVEARLKELNAALVQPRVLETNLRFDLPGGGLSRAGRVLRLRQDTQARMTYKGPGGDQDGVRVRQEIEFVVEDFGAAQRLLEALGYTVTMVYEKYRAVYDLGSVHVTLDELPYGNFVELEGPSRPIIQGVNRSLGLDWEARAPASYTQLFENLRLHRDLPFRDLTFENFISLSIKPEELGVRPADRMAS